MLERPRDGSGAPDAPAGSAPPPARAEPAADPSAGTGGLQQVPRPTRIERLLGCGVPLALLIDLSDPPLPAVVVDLDP